MLNQIKVKSLCESSHVYLKLWRLLMFTEDDDWLNKELMAKLLFRLPTHIFWKDINGIYLGCNHKYAHSLGLSPEDIVGKTDYDLHSIKEESDAFRADDEIVIKMNKPKLNIEETQTMPDGRKAALLTSKVPLTDDNDSVIGVLGIYNDITELKNTQSQLLAAQKKAEQANKSKTEFIQNMQHDIRTPLTSIMMLLRTLKGRKMDEDVREIFKLLEQVCQQLTNLCCDFAKTSLNEDGEESIRKEEINIREVATESIHTHKATAANKNIVLDLHIAEDVPTHITSDGFRLRRILLNVLGNAIKFTDEGKVSLNIAMDKSNELLCMKVSDTGIGINQDKLPFIFDKYVRDNTGDSQKYPGTGLGLYFVKKYVEDLGGKLSVLSEIGKGSVFSIDLP
jgi:PAS domain S-box-containing protein